MATTFTGASALAGDVKRFSYDTEDIATPTSDPLPPDIAKELVGLFKLLSDETRLRILLLLQGEGELK